MADEIVDRLPIQLMATQNLDRGEWFVARHVVSEGEDTCEYLHADGMWRSSTFSGPPHDEHLTGYFHSKEDAQAALAKVRGSTV